MGIVMDDVTIDKIIYNGVEVAGGTYSIPSSFEDMADLLNIEVPDQSSENSIDYLAKIGASCTIPNSYDNDNEYEWRIIGFNHDGTNNTVDLMKWGRVYPERCFYITPDNNNTRNVRYCKYGYIDSSSDPIHYYLTNEYMNGFEDDIKNKMVEFETEYLDPYSSSSGIGTEKNIYRNI